MKVRFACPRCDAVMSTEVQADTTSLECPACHWSRNFDSPTSKRCLACGCGDLWRQKDFPQGIGLTLVVVAGILSTIAWANHYPALAIGILMGFALFDLLLFAWMPDVLKCYRCGAQHRGFQFEGNVEKFELATHERYRQESLRLENSSDKGRMTATGP